MKTVEELLDEEIKKTLRKIEGGLQTTYLAGVYKGLVMAWGISSRTGWYPGNVYAEDALKSIYKLVERKYYSFIDVADSFIQDLVSPFMRGVVDGLKRAVEITSKNKGVEK